MHEEIWKLKFRALALRRNESAPNERTTLETSASGTTLSHTTSLRQAYDMTYDQHDNRKRVVPGFDLQETIHAAQACRKLVVCDKVVPYKSAFTVANSRYKPS